MISFSVLSSNKWYEHVSTWFREEQGSQKYCGGGGCHDFQTVWVFEHHHLKECQINWCSFSRYSEHKHENNQEDWQVL